jgi:uncharacterized 2Fe-2S/4Fe-4S cluster protein (DUF4445 family)
MITVEVQTGDSIQAAAQARGYSLRMVCGGTGVCGKCRVIVRPGENLTPPSAAEREHLSPQEIGAGYRLACQVRFGGPATVTIPEASLDRPDLFAKVGKLCTLDPEPAVRRICLPKALEGPVVSLAEWIERRAATAGAPAAHFGHPRNLQQLSLAGSLNQEITLVTHEVRGITAILPGNRPRSLGIALDIGTTTLAAYLCDLTSGEMVASAAAMNHQRSVGEDVISRIAYCNQIPDGVGQLRKIVVADVNRLIGDCLEAFGAQREEVDAVTVAGNPTMEQILAGLHPRSIGVSPYLPAVRAIPVIEAADIGFDLNPGTPVQFFPLVSGFVGGDTVAALLADGTAERELDTLMIDIGTNGELVFRHGGRLLGTSCATGPALEGAQISCGMRAVPGAIDVVTLGPGSEIHLHTMGDGVCPPLGVCGSGIIDAIAVLLRAGALRTNGRFNPDYPGVVCDAAGNGKRFVLVPAEKSGTGAEIVITLRDVRQLQLAKAALAVGIEFITARTGVPRIPRTVLTGAFGVRFNWRSAVSIGMLPAAVADGEVESRVNLAGMGAAMALVNRSHNQLAHRIQTAVDFIEMAGDRSFGDRFVQATVFPEPAAVRHLWE